MAEQPDKSQEIKEYDDLQKKLQIIKGLREKISAALEKVYQKGEMSPKQITEYLNNPEHFTAQQVETINKSREEVMTFIWDVLGEQKKRQHTGKKLQKKSKKHRRKSLGHRRKWLKMD